MSSTVVVRGSGGAVFEMDVPTSGSALARWNEMLAKGDLVVIDEPKAEKPTPAAKVKPKAKLEPDSEE